MADLPELLLVALWLYCSLKSKIMKEKVLSEAKLLKRYLNADKRPLAFDLLPLVILSRVVTTDISTYTCICVYFFFLFFFQSLQLLIARKSIPLLQFNWRQGFQ